MRLAATLDRIPGHGTFRRVVVGASHDQPALEHMAGRKDEEGKDFVGDALLIQDDNNVDPVAVRVDNAGTTASHLPREDAPGYRQPIARLGHRFRPRKFRARVVGGWDCGAGDAVFYGAGTDFYLDHAHGIGPSDVSVGSDLAAARAEVPAPGGTEQCRVRGVVISTVSRGVIL